DGISAREAPTASLAGKSMRLRCGNKNGESAAVRHTLPATGRSGRRNRPSPRATERCTADGRSIPGHQAVQTSHCISIEICAGILLQVVESFRVSLSLLIRSGSRHGVEYIGHGADFCPRVDFVSANLHWITVSAEPFVMLVDHHQLTKRN